MRLKVWFLDTTNNVSWVSFDTDLDFDSGVNLMMKEGIRLSINEMHSDEILPDCKQLFIPSNRIVLVAEI